MGPQSRYKGFGEVSRNTPETPKRKKSVWEGSHFAKSRKMGPEPLDKRLEP